MALEEEDGVFSPGPAGLSPCFASPREDHTRGWAGRTGVAGMEQTWTSRLEPGGSQDSRRNEYRHLPAQDDFHVLEGKRKTILGVGLQSLVPTSQPGLSHPPRWLS